MLALAIFSALVAYFIAKIYLKARTLPPGPIPFPLVGNFPQFAFGYFRGRGMVDTMMQWREKYGAVFTLWMGTQATVNICSHDLASESIGRNGKIFADRTYMFLMDVVRNGRGVIFSNGDLWSEQRRFALHSLRNMGLGRNIMQRRIMDEVNYRTRLLDVELEKNSGSLIMDPQHFLDLTVGNIINRMLFSERFTEEKEAKFFKLKTRLDELVKNLSLFDLAINNWNKDLPFIKQRLEYLMGPMNEMMVFFREQIEERKQQISSGSHELHGDGDDFVDSFLLKIEENKKTGQVNSFDEEGLMVTLADLWTAGQETTAITLYWAINYLLLHPQVFSNLQQELDVIVGKRDALTFEDRSMTVYLNAVITETLRLSSIVPLSSWRESSEDTVIGGHSIPKGTSVTAQLALLLLDAEHFPNPHEFQPERFVSEEKRLDQFVAAFGFGKRACLGESLARAELYLILGNFVLKYNMKPSPEAHPVMNPPLNMETMRKSQPYKMEISKRREE